MATTLNPDVIQSEASTIQKVWDENTDFKLKDTTLTDFKAKSTALDKSLSDIADKELELTQLRNDRDVLTSELKELCVRARTGFKGYFGADSTQYEQAGGTRKSERKKPSRKSATATAGK